MVDVKEAAWRKRRGVLSVYVDKTVYNELSQLCVRLSKNKSQLLRRYVLLAIVDLRKEVQLVEKSRQKAPRARAAKKPDTE